MTPKYKFNKKGKHWAKAGQIILGCRSTKSQLKIHRCAIGGVKIWSEKYTSM